MDTTSQINEKYARHHRLWKNVRAGIVYGKTRAYFCWLTFFFVQDMDSVNELLLEGNIDRLRSLITFLGGVVTEIYSFEKLLRKYQKSIEAIPALDVAVREHWMTLPSYKEVKTTLFASSDYEMPKWLIDVLIRRKEFLPIFSLFPYMKGSYCNECYTIKADFLNLPLCGWAAESIESALNWWHCTEEFMVDHLQRRDWLGLAGRFLHYLSDWRDPCFYRAMACLLVFQDEGGVFDPEVIYKMIETGFTRINDQHHFYYPFMPRTVGFIRNLMVSKVWKSVQEMKPDDWTLNGEWSRRLTKRDGARSDTFKVLMEWLHDIIIDKHYLTAAELKRQTSDAENSSPKRQKIDEA